MGKHIIWTTALVAVVAGIVTATGCSRGGYEDGAGFSDGFIAGYGQACRISSPATETRWHNATYSLGYADGVDSGIRACNEERRDARAITTLAAHTEADMPRIDNRGH